MNTNVNIRLASDRVNNLLITGDHIPRLYTPGEVITGQQGFMRYFNNFYDIINLKFSFY